MSVVDQAHGAGKFRARASASLDGTAGAFGDGDLLCVAFDGSGELVLSDGTDVAGVIWTRESKTNADIANFKQVVGGRVYTVFSRAEFVEMEQGDNPGAGTALYGAAAGDVGATGVGLVFVGWVDDSGSRLILAVNALPVG